jgi:hypothetical protein
MKITLSTYGGLAAGIRRPPRIVESSGLPVAAAAELARLVAAVKAEKASQEQGPGRARDAMSYKITLDEDDSKTTAITQSDTTMTPAFAALVQWLERHPAGK